MVNDPRRNKYQYDKAKADRVVAFLQKRCRNVKGEYAGEPLKLLDWQEDFVRRLYGEVLPDGRRRYTFGFLWIPKKQGKSTMTAGLSLYMLGPEGEWGAEVYALAGDKNQARIIFDDAKTMVEMDPVLMNKFKTTKYEIRYPEKNGKYQVLSAEHSYKHGLNVSSAIFDELHVQRERDLWETITKGTAAREQPLILSLSNAGIKNTFPHEIYQICKAVEDGEKEMDHWLVKTYEDDSDDSPFDMERIKRANPSFGKTVPQRYYEQQIEMTKLQPSSLNTFMRLHLGVWVGAYDAWIDSESIRKVEMEGEVDWERMKEYECYIGVDLASTRDTTAIVFVWDTEADLGFWSWTALTFVPKDRVNMRGTEREVNFAKWEASGHLLTTPGNTMNAEQIFGHFVDRAEGQDIIGLGYDAWRADSFVAKAQEALGIRVYPVPMTVKHLSRPTQLIERLIFNERLCHWEDPVIRWQFDNVQLYVDGNGNSKIIKQKSKDKVDIPVALSIAFAVVETVRVKRKKPSLFVIQDKIFSGK